MVKSTSILSSELQNLIYLYFERRIYPLSDDYCIHPNSSSVSKADSDSNSLRVFNRRYYINEIGKGPKWVELTQVERCLSITANWSLFSNSEPQKPLKDAFLINRDMNDLRSMHGGSMA